MPNMVTLEMVAIGDTLYMKQDLKWQKVDLEPGMRAEMMKRVIPDATALKDCSRIGTEAVNGLAATIYGYTPPPMEGAPAMGPQKVWIVDDNGLPLKMTSVGADIALFYDDVKPPIP